MSSRKPRSGSYEVGYGRPPCNRQFKPGQSGNPKGRPKKAKADGRDVGALLTSIMNKLVPLTENGTQRLVPLGEALMLRQATSALQGNQQAMRNVTKLLQLYPATTSFENDGTPIDYGAEVRRKLEEMAGKVREGNPVKRTNS